MDTQNTNSSDSVVAVNKFEKLSLSILIITTIISAFAFSTVSQAPLDIAKITVITLGVLLSSIFCAISIFKKGQLYIPSHPSVLIGLLLVVSTFVSTFLSTNIQKSFFGQGFETATTNFIALMFLTVFLIIQLVYKNRERIYYLFSSILLGYLIVVLFQIIRTFNSNILSFGVFNTTTSSLIGKWIDLGIVSGVVFIITFFSLLFVNLSGIRKYFIYLLLVLSFSFLILVNYSFLWLVIALIMLSVGVFNYIKSANSGLNLIKRFRFTVLISFVFFTSMFLWGNVFVDKVVSKLNLQQSEIRLPWQLSLDVTSDTIKNRPFFGAGPNRFGTEFLLHKPRELNLTNFWNVEFSNGTGFIPNFFLTNGIFGGVLWIIFFIIYINLGFRVIKNSTDSKNKFFLYSTFYSSSFLWIVFFVYNPSHFVIFVAFMTTGLFITNLSNETIIKTFEYRRLVTLLSGVVIVILTVWTFSQVKRTVALAYFQSGITSLNSSTERDLSKIENKFKKASSWDESDIYYQALSEVTILKINNLTQQLQLSDTDKSNKDKVQEVAKLIEESVKYTKMAIDADPTNYYNYISQARISELASSLQVQNAYETAKIAYANAINLNPYNPSLYLSLARLEASRSNIPDAQKYIGTALQLKQNYLEAIFLLAQTQVSQGQIKDAITSVQVATQINPNDPLLFFQLGFLHYNERNYEGAIDSLSKAVSLNDQYANARYFLGLSYARLNRNTEAIDQFEKILATNKDNQEVNFILNNLKSSRSPFADAKAPVDNKPEKRKTLPIKEKAVDITNRNKTQK